MSEKPPAPDLRYLLHPEADSSYVHFRHAAEHPFIADAAGMGRRNAWWLADAALLAYWDPPEARERFGRAGMEADALDADGLQGYLAWTDSFAIVAFRGTEADEWKDIFVDGHFALVAHREGTRVHAGFKRSLEGAWPGLSVRLQDLARSRSVWFTGHSLGGALAVLAADRFEDTRGVCTIGCPRVGDAAFAADFDRRFAGRSLRYVNDADIVTHVPPPLPGRYKHVSGLRHIRADGTIHDSAPAVPHYFSDIFGNPLHALEIVNALIRGALTTASDALLDHMPRAYPYYMWNDYARNGD
jgi:hypothetical protein